MICIRRDSLGVKVLLLFFLLLINTMTMNNTVAARNLNDQFVPPRFRKEETAETSLERRIWNPMLNHPIKSQPFRRLESNGEDRNEHSSQASQSEGEKDGDEGGDGSDFDCGICWFVKSWRFSWLIGGNIENSSLLSVIITIGNSFWLAFTGAVTWSSTIGDWIWKNRKNERNWEII